MMRLEKIYAIENMRAQLHNKINGLEIQKNYLRKRVDYMKTREQKINKILGYININWVISNSKTDLLTPQHTKYNCLLRYKDNDYAFTYQCNRNYTRPGKLSLLACLFSDSRCYEDCKESDDDIDNMQNFAREFGYDTDNLKELFKAYKGCKDTYNALKKMFTDEERQLIYEYLEEKEMF